MHFSVPISHVCAADCFYIFQISTFLLGDLPLRKCWTNHSGEDKRREPPSLILHFSQTLPCCKRVSMDCGILKRLQPDTPTHFPETKVAQKLTTSKLDFRSSMWRGNASCNARVGRRQPANVLASNRFCLFGASGLRLGCGCWRLGEAPGGVTRGGGWLC